MEEKKIHPAIAEFAIEDRAELLAQIAEQAREIDELTEYSNQQAAAILKLKQPISNAVVMPEPDFYWVEAGEGSWNSPKEWAQDYYDYNGEKPESVSFSCAIELPNREYDSFEFDADGSCISCRLVNDEVARLNPSRGVPVGWKLVPVNIPCDMVSAFWKAIPVGKTSAIRVQDFWAAMLSAAPSQPACKTCSDTACEPRPDGEMHPCVDCAAKDNQGGVVVPREKVVHIESVLACPQHHTRAEAISAAAELRTLLAGGEK